MEIRFQQKSKFPLSKSTKMKPRNTNKFIGVRQRPSGRWVAEIKDTTQKIRMWLGTFETAEEAARAYDEAACLLRGSNTRTNFITHVSPNSPLASRINKLLNTKKNPNPSPNPSPNPNPNPNPNPDPNPSSVKLTDSVSQEPSTVTSPCNSESNTSDESLEKVEHNCGELLYDDDDDDDDVYKPDLSSCMSGFEFDLVPVQYGPDRFSYTQEMMELPKNVNSDGELPEFERMKVERQFSASLYAMNGLHEYMECVYDPTEALWDLPPLCTLLS